MHCTKLAFLSLTEISFWSIMNITYKTYQFCRNYLIPFSKIILYKILIRWSVKYERK